MGAAEPFGCLFGEAVAKFRSLVQIDERVRQ
jgi:hypothetical protein